MRELFARFKARRLERHKAYFAAVLPPTPAPVVFEFAGLQAQLNTINESLAALLAIEQKRAKHERDTRGY